jgi:hypothetical protein
VPKFKRNESNLELVPEGIYLAQVNKASNKTSSNGNSMIQLILKTIPDRYTLFYHLVFVPECDGMITHFCHSAESELILPDDFEQEFSLTAADCLNRLLFVNVVHEEDNRGDERATVKEILKRVKALAKAPHLADLPFPANVPSAKKVAIINSQTPQTEQKRLAILLGDNGGPDDLDMGGQKPDQPKFDRFTRLTQSKPALSQTNHRASSLNSESSDELPF